MLATVIVCSMMIDRCFDITIDRVRVPTFDECEARIEMVVEFAFELRDRGKLPEDIYVNYKECRHG